jgi:MoaA/NifB/PqqE/SkfB family radical SAM enzyme
MLFRNYGLSGRLLKVYAPVMLRVLVRGLWFAGWPMRLAMVRISLRRWLMWLPSMIRERRLGVKMPVTLQIIDDVGCKAACANCVYTVMRDRHTRLSLDDLDRVLDQALGMGVTNIYLLGADPFYRDDTDALLDLLARHRYQLFLVFSEGQRVTTAHLDRMRAAGNIVPVLNIDGLEEATERRKGDGSWDRVDGLLGQLRDRRMVFGVSTMVSTANFDEVSSGPFVRYLEERGCYFLAYAPYTPVDRRKEAHLVMDAAQRDELFERALAINRVTRRIATFDLLGIEQKLTSCPAGVYTMTVYHDGTVTPCLAIPAGRTESNVRQRDLCDIFVDDPLYVALRKRHADVARANRETGRNDKVHCLFYTDRAFLQQYFSEHADEVTVLAPYAVDGPGVEESP